jgi:hypothetical protein
VSAHTAAGLGFGLLAASCGFAWWQIRQGALDLASRLGLGVHLLGMAVLWLRTDKPVEGTILLRLGERHGLTAADLLVVVPAALSLWLTGLVQPSRVSARLKRR